MIIKSTLIASAVGAAGGTIAALILGRPPEEGAIFGSSVAAGSALAFLSCERVSVCNDPNGCPITALVSGFLLVTALGYGICNWSGYDISYPASLGMAAVSFFGSYYIAAFRIAKCNNVRTLLYPYNTSCIAY